jgi:hypothetical protein
LSSSLLALLTDDLRQPQYRGNPNPLAGHCYVASEVEYHLNGGNPMFIRHEGQPHWFIMRDGEVIDHTASQFTSPVPYHLARGKGFLTRQPSKRAARVLQALAIRGTIC